MQDRIEMRAERDGEGGWKLLAPDAGFFTCALERGATVATGESAGALMRLGRAATLVVPAGVSGVVVSERPERVRAAVGYDDVLYELARLSSTGPGDLAPQEEPELQGGALLVRSPQAGRFYHRSAPDLPAFAQPGDVLEDGAPLGLIEVMKTFTHVPYSAGETLPARARVVRMVAADGADVGAGEPLIEVEEA